MTPIEALKECSIFQHFPDDMLEKITSFSMPKKYSAHETIFEADEIAHNLYLLMEGRVGIYVTKRTQPVLMDTILPAGVFGLSCVASGQFIASAKALVDSEVLLIPSDKLEALLEEDYKVAYNFMKQVSKLISRRLVKVSLQLDITGSGYI